MCVGREGGRGGQKQKQKKPTNKQTPAQVRLGVECHFSWELFAYLGCASFCSVAHLPLLPSAVPRFQKNDLSFVMYIYLCENESTFFVLKPPMHLGMVSPISNHEKILFILVKEILDIRRKGSGKGFFLALLGSITPENSHFVWNI